MTPAIHGFACALRVSLLGRSGQRDTQSDNCVILNCSDSRSEQCTFLVRIECPYARVLWLRRRSATASRNWRRNYTGTKHQYHDVLFKSLYLLSFSQKPPNEQSLPGKVIESVE